MRLALLALLAFAAHAQDLEAVKAPAEGARMTKHVVLLVDCSGSMSKHHAQAVTLACQLAESSSDDYRVHAVAFGEGYVAWPEGWQDMPSAEAVPKLKAWLESLAPHERQTIHPGTWTPSVTYGGRLSMSTRASPAMAKAYEFHKSATVILITDGNLHDNPEPPKGAMLAILQVGSTYAHRALEKLSEHAPLGWYRPRKAPK